MAAPMRMDEGGAAPTKVTAEKSSQRRVNWSVSTTESLIRLWEDNLATLRSNTRNARIYDEMTRSLKARLPAGEGPFTAKQLRQKLENLKKHYRCQKFMRHLMTLKWLHRGCMEESPAPTNENCEAAQNVASHAASCPPSSRKRKRPSSVLQDLVALHNRAEERALENARESLKLRKELVELQKEANNMNKNMAEMMKNYFASRQNKV
ncbi:hypothetical protein HPB49_026433 [Dermacentor silvarum]|nr:hypothetical protein HPB49_026433 [Dermacentor silvarum]